MPNGMEEICLDTGVSLLESEGGKLYLKLSCSVGGVSLGHDICVVVSSNRTIAATMNITFKLGECSLAVSR